MAGYHLAKASMDVGAGTWDYLKYEFLRNRLFSNYPSIELSLHRSLLVSMFGAEEIYTPFCPTDDHIWQTEKSYDVFRNQIKLQVEDLQMKYHKICAPAALVLN